MLLLSWVPAHRYYHFACGHARVLDVRGATLCVLQSRVALVLDDSDVLTDMIISLVCRADLGDLAPKFEKHRITYNALLGLTDSDLQSIGVFEVGARKRLLEALAGWSKRG